MENNLEGIILVAMNELGKTGEGHCRLLDVRGIIAYMGHEDLGYHTRNLRIELQNELLDTLVYREVHGLTTFDLDAEMDRKFIANILCYNIVRYLTGPLLNEGEEYDKEHTEESIRVALKHSRDMTTRGANTLWLVA